MSKKVAKLPLLRSVLELYRALARRIYHSATIRLYALELHSLEPRTPLKAVSSSWEVAINQRQDLERYDPKTGWQSKSDFDQSCTERLARGEVLFSICVDQTLVHYGWVITPARSIAIPEVGQHYELPQGAAYLYDFFTHPAYRNRGIYQTTMRRILDYLQNINSKTAYIGVAPSNVPSCRAIEKIGFQPVATLGCRRIATNFRRWVQTER